MTRGTDYEFVNSDATALLTSLISAYETKTGRTLHPADPDRLFLAWVADVLIAERVNQNYIGNQNIPSRAVGVNLDTLGEWIFGIRRNPAQPAVCTVRFSISDAQETAIAIPAGTRVTDMSQSLVWETTIDAMIAIGETSADVMVQCQTDGTLGNGYAVGQINTLIDADNVLFFASCANTTESDGGSDEEDDNAYYNRMRLVLDSYSTAGAVGSYIYWAKSVTNEIADVKAIRPKRTRTETLTVLTDGSSKFAITGGDYLVPETLKVFPHGSTSESEDYTATYENGTLTIELSESLASETSVDIEINEVKAGCVELYALMNDGTIAGDTIKNAIESACNNEYCRPLTDSVSVNDPEVVSYDITLTYYIANSSQLPLTDIQAAITNAVNEYKEWQSAKLGRDINPSKLWQLLMRTGIKRAVISSPVFTELSSGDDGSVPEIASVGDVTIVNGGYEDE